jgi:hypothetical protein
METTKPENVACKVCSVCDNSKKIDEYYKSRAICIECINNERRKKYKNNEEHRKKLIKLASEFKHKKVEKNQKNREKEQQKIGIENKQCKYCYEIKNNSRFRHNRLKCKDCERDDPIEKFKRYIRTRIYNCLKNHKNKHAIEYLGCSNNEYVEWMFDYDINFNLKNYGKEWHIDHVIPISTFNLSNKEEQMLAFNWRNTMPLKSEENLKKGNKIIKSQIETHHKKLVEYHIKHNLDLPQVYIDLFAKHLVAGSPLEPV